MKTSCKIAVSLMAAALSLSFAQTACAFKVGIAMPTQNEERWMKDGFELRDKLKSAGFDVELFYGGDDDVPIQQRQLPRMVKEGCNALVVASIDGNALTQALEPAQKAGIPVISYDRLIMNTGAVTYYATFDNYKAGVIQGQAIVKALDLDNLPEGEHKTIELFGGSAKDNNSKFFWNGAMEVLKPYFDDGRLIVPSGQTKFEECAIDLWSNDIAQKRMDELLGKAGYKPDGQGDKHLDAIYSSADILSSGIIASLRHAGYTGKTAPVLTGQDATAYAVKSMQEGFQYMTVLKDASVLCDRVVEMAKEIASGKDVEINDTKTYDNGAGFVKTYQCEPVSVDRENMKKLLIDTGKVKL